MCKTSLRLFCTSAHGCTVDLLASLRTSTVLRNFSKKLNASLFF